MPKLSDMQLDALLETFNLLLGQAADGLAELVFDEVQLSAPVISLEECERMVRLLEDASGGIPRARLCAVTQHAYALNSFRADIMQIWTESGTIQIAHRMCRETASLCGGDELSEVVKGAIAKAGDIVTRSCMNHVASLFGSDVVIGDTSVTVDSVAGLSKAFAPISQVLVARICVPLSSDSIVGYVLFLMDVESFQYFADRSAQLFSV